VSRPVEIAIRADLAHLAPGERKALFERDRAVDPEVAARVAEILEDVRVRGDRALLDLSERLDGVRPPAIEVPAAERRRALERLDPVLRAVLEDAAATIERVHAARLPREQRTSPVQGVTVGRRPVPLARIGAYAPGGRAAYQSSVLMCAVPARVAGVGEVVVCSPPGADGRPSPAVLAACLARLIPRFFFLKSSTVEHDESRQFDRCRRRDDFPGESAPGQQRDPAAMIQVGVAEHHRIHLT